MCKFKFDFIFQNQRFTSTVRKSLRKDDKLSVRKQTNFLLKRIDRGPLSVTDNELHGNTVVYLFLVLCSGLLASRHGYSSPRGISWNIEHIT